MSRHQPRLALVFIQSAIAALAITAVIVVVLVGAGNKPIVGAAVSLPAALLVAALLWRREIRSHSRPR